MMLEDLITGRNMGLAAGIFVVMSILRTSLPKVWATSIGQRALPIMPIILGEIGAFIGVTDAEKWQDKMIVGLICGWAASNLFKVGRTSVLGYGIDVATPSEPAPAAPVTPPAAPQVVAPVAEPETKKE